MSSNNELGTDGELVERLRHLVSLNEPRNGGPYGGIAAQECMKAMGEAIDRLSTQGKRLDELEGESVDNFAEIERLKAALDTAQRHVDAGMFALGAEYAEEDLIVGIKKLHADYSTAEARALERAAKIVDRAAAAMREANANGPPGAAVRAGIIVIEGLMAIAQTIRLEARAISTNEAGK